MLLVLLTLLPWVLSSLLPIRTGSQCFKLSGSRECPSQNGLMIQVTLQYSNTKELDEFIKAKTTANTLYIDQLRSDLVCPSFSGNGLQYQITTLCAMLAASATDCSEPDTVRALPVCKETCDLATSSLNSVFNSCVKSEQRNATAVQKEALNSYATYCNRMAILNRNSGFCLDGSEQTIEDTRCGFGTFKEAIAYCDLNSNRTACCKFVDRAGIDSALIVTSNREDSMFWILLITSFSILALILAYYLWNRNPKSKLDKLIQHHDLKKVPRKKTLEFPDDVSVTSSAGGTAVYFSPPAKRVEREPPIAVTAKSPIRKKVRPILNLRTVGPIGSNLQNPEIPNPVPQMAESIAELASSPLKHEATASKVIQTDTIISDSKTPSHQPKEVQSIEPPLAVSEAHPETRYKTTPIDPSAAGSSNNAASGEFRLSQPIVLPPIQRLSGLNITPPVIPTQQRLSVIVNYSPKMPDELVLKYGDVVLLIEAYSDGWAIGQSLSSKEVGVFPLVCTVTLAESDS